MPQRVAVVVKGFPRLSETFVAQELLELERLGLELMIVALRSPTDRAVHDMHRRVRAPVVYLPEYLRDDPRRVFRALLANLRAGRIGRVVGAWLRDAVRDPTPNRVRRFGQSLVLAAELPSDVDWIYSHFIHTSASVTRYTARMRRLPFSISAHAKDIWTSADWDKREKMREARWTVTCSAMSHAHLQGLAPDAQVDLVYHGLDLGQFPCPVRSAGPDGSSPDRPVRLVCVARAVEKKGIDLVLEALARLPQDVAWRLEHVGGGPLTEPLQRRAQALGIDARITWHGAVDRTAVVAALARADLFCLPSRIAGDGDRDGLPNVVLEAMAMALPVVATRVAAIPEAVVDGRTGRLVAPDDVEGLTIALADLARDPQARLAMGSAGRAEIVHRFPFDRCINRLAERFGLIAVPAQAA